MDERLNTFPVELPGYRHRLVVRNIVEEKAKHRVWTERDSDNNETRRRRGRHLKAINRRRRTRAFRCSDGDAGLAGDQRGCARCDSREETSIATQVAARGGNRLPVPCFSRRAYGRQPRPSRQVDKEGGKTLMSLLSSDRSRPSCCRTAKKCDEFSALHESRPMH